MGEERMTREYDDCLKRGKIKPFSRGIALSPKELEAAESDLKRAKKTFEDGDYKWTTIQVYYSITDGHRQAAKNYLNSPKNSLLSQKIPYIS